MGRILYGVLGDSGGHISRSLAIAQQLPDHEVVFVGGGRVQELTRRGYSVVPIPMLTTEISGHRAALMATGWRGFKTLARQHRVVEDLTRMIEQWDPDLIVTDFEHFLPLAARRLGRPCISVNRQHASLLCRYRRPSGHRISRLLTHAALRTLNSSASHYLVCSFVPMQPLDPDRTEVFPPLLRDEVKTVRPTAGDHAVVYVRGASLAWIRATFGGRRRRFIVYGFDIDTQEGNLAFHPHSVPEFLTDLAGCAYVVTNGGHAIISEALYFGKPILSFPMEFFYEQLLNAHLLTEAGYGSYAKSSAGNAAVSSFEARLSTYGERVSSYVPWGCQTIAGRLRELMTSRGATGAAARARDPVDPERLARAGGNAISGWGS